MQKQEGPYPRQSSADRKEALYHDIIDYFDKGKVRHYNIREEGRREEGEGGGRGRRKNACMHTVSLPQLWECGIEQCKENASQLETVTFDYEKLSDIHVSREIHSCTSESCHSACLYTHWTEYTMNVVLWLVFVLLDVHSQLTRRKQLPASTPT